MTDFCTETLSPAPLNFEILNYQLSQFKDEKAV